jgi:AcrR family transcriptional regulator
MARPQIDPQLVREQLFEAAEDIIRLRGAITISMSELASACDMSQSNIYRYFPTKEAFYEAMAERWFEPFNNIMEQVVESDLPPRAKLFEFFARRLAVKRERFLKEPQLFQSYLELGTEHWDVVRGHIDLADHYMATIIGEAMIEGYFPDLELDEALSLVNLMVQPFCNPDVMINMERTATEANLARIIDAIFDGLKGKKAEKNAQPALRVAS